MAAGVMNLLISLGKKKALVVVAEEDYANFFEELALASYAGYVLQVTIASNDNKDDKTIMHLAVHSLPAYFCGLPKWPLVY